MLLLDIKESIYSHIYSKLSLVMPREGKDSSSSRSTSNSLDEIKVLLNEKFDNFSKKLISVAEKFDTNTRDIRNKMEQIENKAITVTR